MGEYGRFGHTPPGDLAVIHVPLLLSYPARIVGGRRIALPVQLLDVMPTILDFAGIDRSGLALAGDSLASLILGKPDPKVERRMVLSEEPTHHPLARRAEPDYTGSVFIGDWQLQHTRSRGSWRTRWFTGFRASSSSRPIGAWEQRDLSLSFDIWSRLRTRRLMLRWQGIHKKAWRSFLAGGGGGTIRVDGEANERLRALGYIQ